jgi:hypothetical protein
MPLIDTCLLVAGTPTNSRECRPKPVTRDATLSASTIDAAISSLAS